MQLKTMVLACAHVLSKRALASSFLPVACAMQQHAEYSLMIRRP